MFVLDLFDFLSVYLTLGSRAPSTESADRPAGPGLRSFVPAGLFTQSKAAPSNAAREALRYETGGGTSNAPIVKGKGSVTVG